MARQLRNMNKEMNGLMKQFGRDANTIWKRGIESAQVSPDIVKTNDGRRAVDLKDLDAKLQKTFNLSDEDTLTGVYLIFKNSDLFYVGHSTNIVRRLKRHFSKPFDKKVSREEKREKPFNTVLEKRNMSIVIYRIADEKHAMFRKTLDRIITYNQIPEYLKQTLGSGEDLDSGTRRKRTSYKRTTA
ncbi:GIY-YIG nuclease family protein [Salinicoccus sesuvii]|uniref:GIY-YIG nuclease family protein n=1 Tax=Salinicoccus sesuvii TaxID=868281 RepID=A0ABV7N630_9STAP